MKSELRHPKMLAAFKSEAKKTLSTAVWKSKTGQNHRVSVQRAIKPKVEGGEWERIEISLFRDELEALRDLCTETLDGWPDETGSEVSQPAKAPIDDDIPF